MYMIEPDLKYCPQCDDEYMPSIEICAACGVSLITGSQKIELDRADEKKLESRGGEISESEAEELVTIRKGPLADTKTLESLLNKERIGTLVIGDESSCGKGCCQSFFLQVRPSEVQDAMKILEKEFRRTTGLHHHEVNHADAVFDLTAGKAVCPACGFAFGTSTTTCPDCGLCLG